MFCHHTAYFEQCAVCAFMGSHAGTSEQDKTQGDSSGNHCHSLHHKFFCAGIVECGIHQPVNPNVWDDNTQPAAHRQQDCQKQPEFLASSPLEQQCNPVFLFLLHRLPLLSIRDGKQLSQFREGIHCNWYIIGHFALVKMQDTGAGTTDKFKIMGDNENDFSHIG